MTDKEYLHDSAIRVIRGEIKRGLKELKKEQDTYDYKRFKLMRIESMISAYMLVDIITYKESVFYANIVTKAFSEYVLRDKYNDR